MIEHVPAAAFTQRTYRLATIGDSNEATLASMGISDASAMLAVLRSTRPPDDPTKFLDGPFEVKAHYQPRQSRFSDGSSPVYYSALDIQTTRVEMQYHSSLRLLGVGSIPGASVFMRHVECTFEGQIKNLTAEIVNIPHLIADRAAGAYDTCNSIAAEARAAGLNGLVTPSARRQPDGICLPVFTRVSLTDPALGGWVTFSHSEADGTISCAEVPA